MFGYCGRLRAVSLFVNRSAMFVEAVFKSTFGFSAVLFVTVVTLYHVDNVVGVAFNVMINKSSFASRIKCISLVSPAELNLIVTVYVKQREAIEKQALRAQAARSISSNLDIRDYYKVVVLHPPRDLANQISRLTSNPFLCRSFCLVKQQHSAQIDSLS